MEKLLSQAIAERRATPSFDGSPMPDSDLHAILLAGLQAPSSYNMQPWRFVVVRSPEQKKRLRIASYNQAKVEEASVMIVACGDAGGWRNGDVEQMLELGRQNGMPENYAEQAKSAIPGYLSHHPNLPLWINRQVMLAFTHMLLTAETLGYDTAPMEGFEEDKVREVLRLPLSYSVVALLGIGKLKGPDKFDGRRFSISRTVWAEEFGVPLNLDQAQAEAGAAPGEESQSSGASGLLPPDLRREYPSAPLVGVGAVIIEADKVLLVRRGREPLKGKWSIPGGALELGETLEEGVVREAREECGLTIEPVKVVEVLDKIVKDDDTGRIRYQYVLIDFLCIKKSGTLRFGSDAADARWVPRSQLNSHGIYRLEPFTVAVIEKAFRMA